MFLFSTAKTVVSHLESASTKEGDVTPASPFPDSPPVPPPRSRHTSASQDSDGSRHSSAERHSLKGMDLSSNENEKFIFEMVVLNILGFMYNQYIVSKNSKHRRSNLNIIY